MQAYHGQGTTWSCSNHGTLAIIYRLTGSRPAPVRLPSGSEMRGLPRPRTPAAAALYISAFVFARWRCSAIGLCFALPALVHRQTARALHLAGASVADAWMRPTQFGRAARARASMNVDLVVPFRTAVRLICYTLGDFGFSSPVCISRLGASACGAGPPAPQGAALPRPPASRPEGRAAAAAPFGGHRPED